MSVVLYCMLHVYFNHTKHGYFLTPANENKKIGSLWGFLNSVVKTHLCITQVDLPFRKLQKLGYTASQTDTLVEFTGNRSYKTSHNSRYVHDMGMELSLTFTPVPGQTTTWHTLTYHSVSLATYYGCIPPSNSQKQGSGCHAKNVIIKLTLPVKLNVHAVNVNETPVSANLECKQQPIMHIADAHSELFKYTEKVDSSNTQMQMITN